MQARRLALGLAVLALALPWSASGEAQGTADESGADPVAGPPKRWMLQFRIERDFALVGFQDAGLSVQRGIGDRTALRLGVGMATSSGTARRVDEYAPGFRVIDESTHGHSYGLDLQWIRYLRTGDETRAYWGVGPSLGYGRSRVAYHVTETSGLIASVWQTQTTWAAGATAAAGAEWWPVGDVGFVFEYGLNIRYEEFERKLRNEDAFSPPNASRTLSKTWEMELASVRLGVGIRW